MEEEFELNKEYKAVLDNDTNKIRLTDIDADDKKNIVATGKNHTQICVKIIIID